MESVRHSENSRLNQNSTTVMAKRVDHIEIENLKVQQLSSMVDREALTRA